MFRFSNKVLDRPPRALVLADRLAASMDERRPTARQVEPLIPLYASGALPLDEAGKRAVADTMESWWRRLQRMEPQTPEP